jgi:hypothetical protein
MGSGLRCNLIAYMDYCDNGIYFISFSKDDGLYRHLSNSLLGLKTLMQSRELRINARDIQRDARYS